MSTSNNKEVTIIVNGRPKKHPAGEITFSQVVSLAFSPVPPNTFYTVTYSHGHEGGTLVEGQTVTIRGGMKFDVTPTGQS